MRTGNICCRVGFAVVLEVMAVRLARERILIGNLILCKNADRLLQSAHSAGLSAHSAGLDGPLAEVAEPKDHATDVAHFTELT
jgi:hypothetical protein